MEEIRAKLKIDRLNPMQEAAIEMWKKGQDVVLLSPTGSGKTLAYLLPLVAGLKPKVNEVQAVVLVPSRELALQTADVFRSMGTPFKAVSCYGGRPAMDEHRLLREVQPAVVIGTPGRLNDHLSKGNFEARTVAVLVIDEFDKCLQLGFRNEMQAVVGQLPGLQRRFLLSATDAEEIPQFTGVGTPIRLDFLSPGRGTKPRIRLYRVDSPEKDKLETLFRLLCVLGNRSALVFCNHRESVERVGKYLWTHGLRCGIFHGGMDQEYRERALYKFRNGSCHVLVSTDLAARGLDIPVIEHVVHYHLPENEHACIHRNGRTARWEAEGNAYILLHPEETLPAYLTEGIESFPLPEEVPAPARPRFATLYIGKGKKDKISKRDIVGFLSKKGRLGKDEVGQVDVKDRYAYAAIAREKLEQTLLLLRNEKIKGVKTVVEEAD